MHPADAGGFHHCVAVEACECLGDACGQDADLRAGIEALEYFGVIFGERSHFAQTIYLRVDAFFGAFEQHVDLRGSGAYPNLDCGGDELGVQDLAEQVLQLA